MAIGFNQNGPLKNAKLVKINEAIFWDKTRIASIDAEDDDEKYLVKTGDRIDLLAAKKLNDPARGWIIMRRNNLTLWPNDLVPGVYIFIPTLDSLARRGVI